MKKFLGAVTGLLLLGVACGDLSEMSDDELRAFVQRAKRVAIEELLAGGNSQTDVDNVIKIVAEGIEQKHRWWHDTSHPPRHWWDLPRDRTQDGSYVP